MEIKIITKDEHKTVKAVFLNNRFMYTVTYIYDDEGYVDKMIRVYADGTVDVQ